MMLEAFQELLAEKNAAPGGHPVLTQHPGAYAKQLEKDAINANKRAQRQQEHYDRYKTDPDYRRRFDQQAFRQRRGKSKPGG
jgi:hypothetical protein